VCLTDLARHCTIVFSMLANDSAVESVVDSFLEAGPKPGSIFVDSSTVYPDLSTRLASKAAEKQVLYVTAPIFGRPDAVLAHRGLHICAGDPSAKARVRRQTSFGQCDISIPHQCACTPTS
jgi:3-hydroxyisobutyrate dehydrogenase-like beta-hydroxyacid dehydrogenase